MLRSGAYFISRAKITLDLDVVENNFYVDEETGLISDKTIKFSGFKTKNKKIYLVTCIFNTSVVITTQESFIKLSKTKT